MPKRLEEKLKKEAKEKDVRDKDAYVYGTLNKIEKRKELKMRRGH